MDDIAAFQNNTKGILNAYSHGDYGLAQANVMLDLQTQDFLAGHLIDTPTNILESAVTAYADLHVQAAQQGDISPNEACRIIEEHAYAYLENSCPPEYIEDLRARYEQKLDSEGGKRPPQNDGIDFDAPSFN